jgi:uracil-DNA glycosylase
MPNNKLAKLLTDTLTPGPNLFNPWHDRCDDDMPCDGPDARLARLAAHLNCKPKFILCGEAPSHRGCRHSGIAFTSECQLLAGEIPRISKMNGRLTIRDKPYSERSATVVWDELRKLRIKESTILWNALPMHPHEKEKPHSNRTPRSEEIKKGKPALERLLREFPSATVIAVGRKAERSLKSMGVCAEYVRHPAHGGEAKFRQKLKRLVSGQSA